MAALRAPEPLDIPASRVPIPAGWHRGEAIDLWPGAPPGGCFVPSPRAPELPESFRTGIDRPQLRLFRPAMPNGAALLVLPGGGYGFVSIRNEGLDIADAFCARGYAVFVLTYRLPAEGWSARADVPLMDAQRAMRLVRARATAEGFDPAAVAVLGFSAGGHLAASLLTGAEETLYAAVDAADALSAHPMAGGLFYPVVAMDGADAHPGSREALLGETPEAALLARRSPATRITGATPPIFLVHAMDDALVPFGNSVLLAEAMQQAGRPVELHLFHEGGHGFGTGPRNAGAGQWTALFDAWLRRADTVSWPDRA
ncbi:alpha/beta hydrolase [Sphingomonas pokkalii]|uniref:Alpha/beta hydrolase n=1 Tax=Sphingomonas pokkalii TaxID=2175090 RepID=A0A2U0SJQ3_9SPHN|nr:alpha/beta hydrolase [Sphingomonas pokkalii]PVX31559.1 alpha/beta hydrolase [Sphingomonas pokkalii]